MSNGSNNWGVSWLRICFLQRILDTHNNIASSERSMDIVFSVDRDKPPGTLRVLCCDEYVCGIAAVRRALSDFGQLDMIYIGGNWNGYTKEAKDYCQEHQIGLYNASELSGGLWKKDFWSYAKKDDDGNPIYFYRAA